jgi:hypothetical protein
MMNRLLCIQVWARSPLGSASPAIGIADCRNSCHGSWQVPAYPVGGFVLEFRHAAVVIEMGGNDLWGGLRLRAAGWSTPGGEIALADRHDSGNGLHDLVRLSIRPFPGFERYCLDRRAVPTR